MTTQDPTLKPRSTPKWIDDSLINDADKLFDRAASATPMPSAEKTAKAPKATTKAAAPKAKAAKPAKVEKDAKPKTTWAGETGPDNAVTVDGEQQ
jgi:hypothetical protein